MVIWWHAPARELLSPVAINTAGGDRKIQTNGSTEREKKPQPCSSALGRDVDDKDGSEDDDVLTSKCYFFQDVIMTK